MGSPWIPERFWVGLCPRSVACKACGMPPGKDCASGLNGAVEAPTEWGLERVRLLARVENLSALVRELEASNARLLSLLEA